jgi:thermitase
VSPNIDFPPNEAPDNAIAQRVLKHPRVTYDVNGDVLVIAIRDELLVRKSIRTDSPALDKDLSEIARNCGSLASEDDRGPHDEVELWRLTDDGASSIDVARSLRRHVDDRFVRSGNGPNLMLPAVSPNHVLVVSRFSTCPAGPPLPAPDEPSGYIEAPDRGPTAKVVVIDTGYISIDPPNAELDGRVLSVPGQWRDTIADPAVWRDSDPDVLDADGDGRLDGVAGHGTFIAGQVAHRCRQAEITVVGLRHEAIPLSEDPDSAHEPRLFTSEYAVAHSLLEAGDADVVACGFSFPTLDGYASIPFTSVMQILRGPNAPRPGIAVVAPAGNESSGRPHWPAAHPDVIGVASTDRSGLRRADFSNWGSWADCAVRGEHVTSTFIRWEGPVEGDSMTSVERFYGWARWDGTSFAAPKVTAEIARIVADSDGATTPVDAAAILIGGVGGVTVTPMTDTLLFPFPGVTLPHLHLG